MKYLCDFRLILHTWTDEPDGTEWTTPQHEVMNSDVWDSRFLFRSKKQKEEDSKSLSFWLDASRESDKIKFIEDTNAHAYYNVKSMRSIDYAAECIKDYNIASLIVENDLKDSKGEKYYEIIGKLVEESWTDYWGECDSDFDVEDIQIQEIDEKDVEEYCKQEGINLINKEENEKT